MGDSFRMRSRLVGVPRLLLLLGFLTDQFGVLVIVLVFRCCARLYMCDIDSLKIMLNIDVLVLEL